MTAIDEIRKWIVGTTTGLFAHAPYRLRVLSDMRGTPGWLVRIQRRGGSWAM